MPRIAKPIQEAFRFGLSDFFPSHATMLYQYHYSGVAQFFIMISLKVASNEALSFTKGFSQAFTLDQSVDPIPVSQRHHTPFQPIPASAYIRVEHRKDDSVVCLTS